MSTQQLNIPQFVSSNNYVHSMNHVVNTIKQSYQILDSCKAMSDETSTEVREIHQNLCDLLCSISSDVNKLFILKARMKIIQSQCKNHEYAQMDSIKKLFICKKCLCITSNSTY